MGQATFSTRIEAEQAGARRMGAVRCCVARSAYYNARIVDKLWEGSAPVQLVRAVCPRWASPAPDDASICDHGGRPRPLTRRGDAEPAPGCGYEELKASITADGIRSPIDILATETSVEVGDGHHRITAAIDLGMLLVPVRVWRAVEEWRVPDFTHLTNCPNPDIPAEELSSHQGCVMRLENGPWGSLL